jgi:large subunit ribosomal protein L4e
MFMEANVLSLEGTVKGKVELPSAFDEEVRPDLILRAVLAESTRLQQPQAHYPLAGMQTTAQYYGRMHTYRTGRHMGQAIRPRQKLAHGVQGKVRVIPSAVKGKRAHPHLAAKTIIEEMNKKEYQKAIASAVSATASLSTHTRMPIVVADEIESISKTKDMIKLLTTLKLIGKENKKKARIKKGLRRSTRQKHYRKSVLLVIGNENAAIKAARNIAGVDACIISNITANLLAPGGNPGRPTVWSEHAIKSLEASINKQNLA